MIEREEIILKMEELKKELKTWEKVLQVIDRSGIKNRTGSAMRFNQQRPLTAIKMVLREKGPLTQSAITQELVEGGAIVGKKRAISNIRISIEKTLKNGTLKQIGDLIGLPEWGPDQFDQN